MILSYIQVVTKIQIGKKEVSVIIQAQSACSPLAADSKFSRSGHRVVHLDANRVASVPPSQANRNMTATEAGQRLARSKPASGIEAGKSHVNQGTAGQTRALATRSGRALPSLTASAAAMPYETVKRIRSGHRPLKTAAKTRKKRTAPATTLSPSTIACLDSIIYPCWLTDCRSAAASAL